MFKRPEFNSNSNYEKAYLDIKLAISEFSGFEELVNKIWAWDQENINTAKKITDILRYVLKKYQDEPESKLKKFIEEKFDVIIDDNLEQGYLLKENGLLDSIEKPIAEKKKPQSKSEPNIRPSTKQTSSSRWQFLSSQFKSESKPINKDKPTLRIKSSESRVGTMFGTDKFCYGDKPSGVEPGFRAVDLNDKFFNYLESKNFSNKQLKELSNNLQNCDDLSSKQQYFADHILSEQAKIELYDTIKKGVDDSKLTAWLYKLDYAKDSSKSRVEVNKAALREYIGTKLASIFSKDNQNQELVWLDDQHAGSHAMLACSWKSGLRELTKFLDGGNPPDYTGILVEDKMAEIKRSKVVNGLGKNLIFGIAIGDRDGIGKNAQNKGLAEGVFYGFDYGKPYEGKGVVDTLNDDFSFQDPAAGYPAILRGESFLGQARHFMYRNYSIFYDTPLSERMEGVHLLRKMITGQNPSPDVMKSYPGLEKQLNEITKNTPTPHALLRQIDRLNINIKDKKLNSILVNYKNKIKNSQLPHFNSYFMQMKLNILKESIENNMPPSEVIDYLTFIENAETIANQSNVTILNVFKKRLDLTAQQIDFIDKLEKITSPTSILSTNKQVILNHLRIDGARVPFQLTKEEDNSYTLSTKSNTETANLLAEMGVTLRHGKVSLTQGQLKNLMATVDKKYNEKKERAIIDEAWELTTKPSLVGLLNNSIINPTSMKATVALTKHSDRSLSLNIKVVTDKQAKIVQRLFQQKDPPELNKTYMYIVNEKNFLDFQQSLQKEKQHLIRPLTQSISQTSGQIKPY